MNATVQERDWGFLEPYVYWLDDIDASYLIVGAVAMDIGDILTTYIGVLMLGIPESNPVAASLLSSFGVLGLVALKVVKYLVTLAIIPVFTAVPAWIIVKFAGLFYTGLGALTLMSNTLALVLN